MLGLSDGAGALLELDSTMSAPHLPQNRLPGINGLPHAMQKVFMLISN